jgi:hypothetical protein
VLEALGTHGSRDELRADYPELEDEDIQQALGYAAAMLGDETVETKPLREAPPGHDWSSISSRLMGGS